MRLRLSAACASLRPRARNPGGISQKAVIRLDIRRDLGIYSYQFSGMDLLGDALFPAIIIYYRRYARGRGK